MPKEITHWIAAERIKDLIRQGRVREAINRYPDFYYLGAVVYDSPFYAYGVRNVEQFGEIVGKLHGTDHGDTFEPFRAFFTSFPSNPPDEALSFISGAFTHYSMDVIFHPFVNYFSGKYASDDPAKRTDSQTRHRTFEGLMDIYFSGVHAAELGAESACRLGSGLQNGGRFSQTLQGLANNREMTNEVVSRFFGIDTQRIPIWPLLERHGLIQRQLFRRMLSAALNLAGAVAGGPLAVIAATFYPAIRSQALREPAKALQFFAAPITGTHPNTGEALRGTADDFAARATIG